MTVDALTLYDQQKEYQIEEGNFSQIALNGIAEIKGVFDDPNGEVGKDSGHGRLQGSKPRFIVNGRPSNIFAGTTVLVINSKNYKILSVGDPDKQGYVVLWLQLKVVEL